MMPKNVGLILFRAICLCCFFLLLVAEFHFRTLRKFPPKDVILDLFNLSKKDTSDKETVRNSNASVSDTVWISISLCWGGCKFLEK